jgi:Abnormal spindle-like microcephaly-assoc'd, ASPM-SPD-2-Hydin
VRYENKGLRVHGFWDNKGIVLAVLVASVAAWSGCGAANSTGGTSQTQNLTLGSSALNFGTVVAGANSTLSDTVTNSSTNSITISSASISNSSFKVSSPALPISLAPGQSTNIVVAFAPQAAGKPAGMVTLATPSGQVQIAVSGTAVSAGSLSLSPSAVSFGNVVVGKSQTQSVTVTNSGGSAVTVSQASASNASFSVSSLPLPLNLNPGQSANFSVIFVPTSAGSVSGSIAVAGSASLSAQTPGQQALTVSASLNISGDGVSSGRLSAAPAFVDFGDVTVGTKHTQSATLTNSGSTSITISQASVNGSAFSFSGVTLPAVLAAGQSVSFSVGFTPSASGTSTGGITFASDATNATLSFPLSGVGVVPGALTANPTSLSFGSVQVGSSRSLSETLTNSGTSTISLSQATVSGSGFKISGLTAPTQLTAGQSLTFTVVFAPASAGAESGSITISSNAPNSSLAIPLSGTGAAIGQLTVSPSSLSFGNVNVGTSKGLTSTLTASGASVTISSASSNSSEFSISGLSLPATLSAGQSATFTLTFSPQASGSTSASIGFTSNASNAASLAAGGTGVASASHSVSLAWQASTSAVVGYNVYRGTQSGGPYQTVNSSLVPATDYTDSSVAAGATYYYVLTSVDSEGLESVQSNQVTAVIPTP